MNPARRRALAALSLAGLPRAGLAGVVYPDVRSGASIAFPRDHGSHPDFRTEWWYVTGWTTDASGVDRGVQVTFFRNRPGLAESSGSAFAPRELLFAHAAIADARRGAGSCTTSGPRAQASASRRLRRRRPTFASTTGRSFETATATGPASRRATSRSTYGFRATQPVLLQGERGVSRKGPLPGQASGYYSVPQLDADGTIAVEGRTLAVSGRAWLDHEWSSSYLAPAAAGWDWIGVNLDDGAALMAFRMRGRDGGTFWAGGTLRDASGRVRTYAPHEVAFAPGRTWRSPRTGVVYPVTFDVRVADFAIALEPLMDDQELDARGSVGIVYWEGAVRVRGSGGLGGRGYLELTGYGDPLVL